MKKMTKKALDEAFAGESKAHMKYLIYSEIAEKEGYENISRLFRAIAFAEKIHAKNHMDNLGLSDDTLSSLENGINGEDYEVSEMYPVFLETAKFQGEKDAQKSLHYALEAEKIHLEMYNNAREKVRKKEDIELGDMYVCPVCGYTHEGNPPEKCPVCGVNSDKFKNFK